MKTNSFLRRYADVLIGWGLGLASLVLYAGTLARGAYYGMPANLVAQRMGLALELTPDRPLWKGLASGVAGLGGDAAFSLNALSAVCGAISIALLYILVCHAVRRCVDPAVIEDRHAVWAARLAGATAALALAFSTPFWVVSTRAHTAPFHILLLLTAMAVLVRFSVSGYRWQAFLFAALYGLGLVEYEAFWPLAPLVAGYFLFLCWHRKMLRPLFVTAVAAVAVLALATGYAWATFRFSRLEGFMLRDFSGWGAVLWDFWRVQYVMLAKTLPRVGWLTLVLFTILPWLICLLIARRALNEEKDVSFYILHLILAGISASILLNLPFSPWGMSPGTGHVRVMPYVLMAMTTGYLVAYAWLLPLGWWPDERARPLRRALARLVLAVPLMGVVVYTGVRNVGEADASSGEAVNRYVAEVVASVPEPIEWLVTDGVLDDLIALEAHRQGRSLKLFNLHGGSNSHYVRYMAGELTSPRLRNLAEIDFMRMAYEWVGADRATAKTLAVLAFPDLWVGAGYEPLPHGLVFLAADPGVPLAADTFEKHDQLWQRLEAIWAMLSDAPSYLNPIHSYMRTQASMNANNVGVLLEDAGRQGEAYRAYAAARAINPGNVSALLNQWAIVNAGVPSDDKEALDNDLKELGHAVEQGGLNLWALSRRHGYVRAPQAFQIMGWGWAMSGKPGAGIAGMQRALDLAQPEQRTDIKQTLADMHLMSEDDEQSEALYFELLVENPENIRALLGMARVATRKGAFDAAADYLEQARKAGADPRRLAMERASLHLSVGARDEARIVLEDAVEKDPANVRAWAMLAEIFAREGNRRDLARALRPLENERRTAGLVPVLRGEAALNQGDLSEARQQFDMAYAMGNRSRHVLDRLLALTFTQGDESAALRYARQMLRTDLNHSLANFILGMTEQQRGDADRAEDFYRRSLGQRRFAVALNNLAMLLLEREAYEEAEPLILEALAAPDTGGIEGHLHDTHGLILMRTGRLTEAQAAFEAALAITPPVPAATIHLTELFLKKNDLAAARRVLDKAESYRSSFSVAESARLDELRRRVTR